MANLEFDQAQDAPTNSALEEENAGSPIAESVNISDSAKANLQEMMKLMSTEIGELVMDAEPIRPIFNSLHDQVLELVAEALIPAA